jgi:hypothetical protein
MNQSIPRIAGCFGALLVVGLSPACLKAADPANRDLQYTVLARSALAKDRELAPLNLGVRVHNRVAVLWGPVPSVDLMQRAVQVLRNVPELLEVRNELHVEPGEMPPPLFLPERTSSPAVLPGFSPPDETLPGTFSRRAARMPGLPVPGETVLYKPAVVNSPAGEEDGTRFVLPPIIIPAGGVAPAPLPAKSTSLEEAVRRLQQTNPRFQGLRAVVLPGQIRLSGSAVSWEDVYGLASALARLPGVERVVLDQVRTLPAK